ncbi:hypothetical protein Q5P01_002884 [Channa striata]|uniref:Ig-like domain-containing protein n=1 Tax=Channa striata TaxID=64152 RepID=A0AA88NTK1_CHASR|nr:hypothetical protein Q5P01_002884 [Channa striata]
MMLFHTDRKPLKYNLVIISVSVFQLILTQFCTGQSQLIGASQPIVATFVVTLAGLETTSSGVVLQCESKGWNPEPEVLWLDGEGHVLSAGPTEIVRGPDDLYTVSSRVTVDKRHGNRFTCRVQQTIINQTRETHMQVSDDFFYVQSSIFPVTVGLVVSVAVCILSFLAIVLLWRKKNSSKCKIRQLDENDKGQRNICFKPGKTKDQIFIEEKGERETLMVDKTEQMEEMDGKRKKKKNKTSKIHQKKEEAEITVKNLEEELETKRTEVENKESELQQLHEENQEREKNLQTVKDKLEAKNKELQTVKAQIDQRRFTSFSKETLQTKKTVVEKEVETLKKQLETMETESQTRITEIQDKQADVQRLKDGIQKMETNQQMNDNTEVHLSTFTLEYDLFTDVSLVQQQTLIL